MRHILLFLFHLGQGPGHLGSRENTLGCFSVAVVKTMIQSKLGKKGFIQPLSYIILGSQGRDSKARLKQKPWRNDASGLVPWLTLPPFL